ncbi:Uncharacterized protein APZ42_021099 [Daphnia magna]|uniref:Polyhydroxybutyrate depolymerase n=1 Tax=Daphnia magna TaxID=35525 RepID=A0A164WZS4_9CRUS|nr:Uncharacterized protein APZ42_021099 [Daphnia magna]
MCIIGRVLHSVVLFDGISCFTSSRPSRICSTTKNMLKSAMIVVFLAQVSLGQIINLQPYAIEPGSLTVSGISAGAAMATQFHVAFSADVNGVGIFAGIPYGCAKGSLAVALNCMSSPFLTSVPTLIDRTDGFAQDGTIDPTSNMSGDRVYVFHGTRDSTVNNRNGEQVVEFYQNYLSTSDIATEFTIAAEHCQPTDNFGGECNRQNTDNYINDCDYRGAFLALNHLYGGSLLPDTTAVPESNLFQFDQAEFFGGRPESYSMDSVGYIYIPTECKDPTRYCKLHVVLHGCLQSSQEIGDVFVKNAGYLEVAESNAIILLFPQVVRTPVSNPNACFDWWGYAGNDYDLKTGVQMDAIYQMCKRLGL